MPYIDVNDIRIYYEELGRGEPLLLLHGAIDFHRAGWAGLVPSFAERHRAIQLEHRGHGQTNNPSGRVAYDLIADDVAAFIEQLGDAQPGRDLLGAP